MHTGRRPSWISNDKTLECLRKEDGKPAAIRDDPPNNDVIQDRGNAVKVKICPHCEQAFSTTAAGLELMYAHLMQEHELAAEAADEAIDEARTEEREEALPVPLPRCS